MDSSNKKTSEPRNELHTPAPTTDSPKIGGKKTSKKSGETAAAAASAVEVIERNEPLSTEPRKSAKKSAAATSPGGNMKVAGELRGKSSASGGEIQVVEQLNVSSDRSTSTNIASKKDLLMNSLIKFYNDKRNMDEIKRIISSPSISLRILDWFVTNYSKKYNINYMITTPKRKNFIVYLDYKAQLKAYSKKQFDPFCRRDRISFIDHDNNELITTVGQLNFFRWSIENKILDYVRTHHDDIEKDMNTSLKNLYKKKEGDKQRRKRTELSISATKTVNKHNINIVVQFD